MVPAGRLSSSGDCVAQPKSSGLGTDAPDMPPHWIYRTAAERSTGLPQGRNAPAELPRIAQVLADLRGMPLEALAQQTEANAVQALPRLRGRVG